VLVIDNQGRTDESCIGDLTVLEARTWGLSGFVVRGLIRDTSELIKNESEYSTSFT
jgi:regulator of RNase E activity RraA